MLIRCEGCGKLFDYEARDGVCPACGQVHFGRDAEAAPGFADEPARRPRSHSPARRVTLTLACIWVLVMVIGAAFWTMRRSTLAERAAAASPVVAETSGGFACGRRTVTVGAAEQLGQSYRAGLPEDACLVRVWLQFTEDDYRGWNDDLLYLQLGDEFFEAADSYSLNQLYPALAADALDRSVLQGIAEGEGWLYFVVPDPPRDAALYLELADGYGDSRRVTEAQRCPVQFAPAAGGDAGAGTPDQTEQGENADD